jgi:hypothetical protein
MPALHVEVGRHHVLSEASAWQEFDDRRSQSGIAARLAILRNIALGRSRAQRPGCVGQAIVGPA